MLHDDYQIQLMLTEIAESRAAFKRIRKMVKATSRKLQKFQDAENGEGVFLGDVLDDLATRLYAIEKTLPNDPEALKS